MQIAHVTFSFWPVRGGADAYLAELAIALHAAGHEQTVYQATISLSNEKGQFTVEPGIEVVEWPVAPHLSPGRRFWLLTAQVARHRAELLCYDRVIAHYPNYALPLLDHPGLIGLSHGVTWDCGPRSAPSNRVKRAIAETAFRRARQFVSNDTFFLREMGLPVPSQSHPWQEAAPGKWFLPNAVDLSHFHPDSSVPTMPILLLPRNLYRNRGIHLGIEAFAELSAEWPDLRLRIVGDWGDAGYREECEALAEKLNVTSRVEFTGSVPWLEMPGEYRRAAVSLIPSLCGEGTSLAALESMACGTPVVATTAGGLPDLPCVHTEIDPHSLAQAVDEVLCQRDAYSHQHYESVSSDYGLQRWAETWRRVVEE